MTQLPNPLQILQEAESMRSFIVDLTLRISRERTVDYFVEDFPGGGPDGTFGTDGGRVLAALQEAAGSAGAVVLMDLGSSVLSVRAALGELPEETVAQLRIADAPLVEGAIAAGVTASTGGSVDEVLAAAQEARTVAKL